ncbi:hypothetical protein HDU86_000370 [Geranomyces michiganensis]|nr:hypothetical protein HDU86_000370 [Geranomyces michiganensis]
MPVDHDTDLDLTLTGKPRKRLTQSCDRCKIKKRRCSGTQPCSNCSHANARCTMLIEQKKRGPKRPSSAAAALVPSSSSSSARTPSVAAVAASARPRREPRRRRRIPSPESSIADDDDDDDGDDEEQEEEQEEADEEGEEEQHEESNDSINITTPADSMFSDERFFSDDTDDEYSPRNATAVTPLEFYEPLQDDSIFSLLTSAEASTDSFFSDLGILDSPALVGNDIPAASAASAAATRSRTASSSCSSSGLDLLSMNGFPQEFHLHLINCFFTFFAPVNPIVHELSFFDALAAVGERGNNNNNNDNNAPLSPRLSPALLYAVCSIGALYSTRPEVEAMGGRLRASADLGAKAETLLRKGADVVARCLLDIRTFGSTVNGEGTMALFPEAWRIAQKTQLGFEAPCETIFSVINAAPYSSQQDSLWQQDWPEFHSSIQKKHAWWGIFTMDTFAGLTTGYDLAIDESLYMASLLNAESLIRVSPHCLAAERHALEHEHDFGGGSRLAAVSQQQQQQQLPQLGAAVQVDLTALLGGFPKQTVFGPAAAQVPGVPGPVTADHIFTPLPAVHPHIRVAIFLRKILRSTALAAPSTAFVLALHAKLMQLCASFSPQAQQYLAFDQPVIPHGTERVPTGIVHTVLMVFACLSLLHQAAVDDPVPRHDVNGTAMSSGDICVAVYRRLNVLLEDIYASRFVAHSTNTTFATVTAPPPPPETVASPFTAALIAIPAVPLLASASRAPALLFPTLTHVPCLEQTILPTLDEMSMVWPRASRYAAGLRGWAEVVKERGVALAQQQQLQQQQQQIPLGGGGGGGRGINADAIAAAAAVYSGRGTPSEYYGFDI